MKIIFMSNFDLIAHVVMLVDANMLEIWIDRRKRWHDDADYKIPYSEN
jgi:hypothetical protein